MARGKGQRQHPSVITSLKVAGTYIGAVVGAGFASGQEVLQFFGFHGVAGIWGLMLSSVLFIVFGLLVMELGRKVNATSHLQVIQALVGPQVGRIMDAMLTVSLCGSLIVLTAGGGAVLHQLYGVPSVLGNSLLIAVTTVTVLTGIEGVILVVSGVAPFMIMAVLLTCLLALNSSAVQWDWAQPHMAVMPSWVTAAFVYASHNSAIG